MPSSRKYPNRIAWNTFYNIPVVHYSDRIMEQQPPRARQRWHQCLKIFQKLEAEGILVHLVPLSYDHKTQGLWSDYPDDYVAHAVQDGESRLDQPHLNVVLKIDDEGHWLADTIMIHHFGIRKALKKQLISVFSRYQWLVWNGKASRTMEIHLQ